MKLLGRPHDLCAVGLVISSIIINHHHHHYSTFDNEMNILLLKLALTIAQGSKSNHGSFISRSKTSKSSKTSLVQRCHPGCPDLKYLSQQFMLEQYQDENISCLIKWTPLKKNIFSSLYFVNMTADVIIKVKVVKVPQREMEY